MADKTNPDAQTRWERFQAWMDGESAAKPSASQPAEESAELKELRLKAAKADKYKEQIEGARKTAAESFANGLIASKQLLPAAKDKVVAAYIQASQDDELSPLATGSRVEQFKASFTDLPKHSLTKEFIEAGAPDGAMALNPDAGTEKESLDAAEKNTRAWAEKQNPKSNLREVSSQR